MPKTLILGNGNMLIGYDARAQVRDLYFPYVGLENQTGGYRMHKVGIWVDNQFSWTDWDDWQITSGFVTDSLVSHIRAINAKLAVELNFTDVVYNERDIFIRQVEVKNLSTYPRLIKIFFNQQFELYDSFRKDTAYYDPHHQVIIHYKGRRAFVVNAIEGSRGFDDYSVGLISIEGHEGTYKDAEDGSLTKNPIEHGPVDSVISLSLNIDGSQSKTVHYWLTASKLISEALDLNQYILEKTPQYLIKSTKDFWFAWSNRQNFDFNNLQDPLVDLFKKSLLIIRTHVDNRGAIIASCDSDMLQYGRDTYSYVWPRDGAFSAIALDRAGDHEVAKRFFQFCNDIVSPEGYFMHKYRPDQALGSSWHPWVRDGQPILPIQEDETALVIFSLWLHYQTTRNLEFIEEIYNSLIKRCAEFMVTFRDQSTGLPLPSYDLWEEKYGISTFTASSVYGALTAAGKFADLLGKNDSANRYREAAAQVRAGILKYLWNEEQGYFYKMINFKDGQTIIDPVVDISSAYGIFKFRVLEPADEKLSRAMSYSMYRLGLTTLVGGICRYDGDRYYRSDHSLPGNPWFICTLWLAQYYLTQANSLESLASVSRLLNWAVKHALPSGILSEQLDPHTGAQISAAPLTWSHSEYVITVLEYLDTLLHLNR